MANEQLFMWFILLGFLLGKKLPTSVDAWRKWWYHRRGIAYFLIYILEAGKIIYRGMLKQDKTTFSYDKGRYITYKKEDNGRLYTPCVELDDQKIIFYNKNNTNPLEFLEKEVTPSHNDPELFQTIIEDNSIRQALSPELDLSDLKRYILITMGILGLAIAGFMYLLIKM